jgi:DNA-binding transcriptional ArsR family regulator
VTDEEVVRVFKALGDAKRFRMVREIAEAGELNCGQLGERFPLSQPAVSHHLKILTDAGVLQVRVDGQHRYVSVNHDVLQVAGLQLSGAPAASPRARAARRPPARRRRA